MRRNMSVPLDRDAACMALLHDFPELIIPLVAVWNAPVSMHTENMDCLASAVFILAF